MPFGTDDDPSLDIAPVSAAAERSLRRRLLVLALAFAVVTVPNVAAFASAFWTS